MESKIKDIYNVSFDISDISGKDRCPIHDWYNSILNKTYNQLDLFDVSRMLIQKIFLELAISKSIEFIEDNPFCGQRYEGELIELLAGLDLVDLENYKEVILLILAKALIENKKYDWLCEEEREEFCKLINSFQLKLTTK